MALDEIKPNFKNILLLQLKPNAESKSSHGNLRSKSKKCLFGPADPLETYKLIKENFDYESLRFYERFGISIEDLDRLAEDQERKLALKSQTAADVSMGKRSSTSLTSSRHHKRALKPYNRDNNQQQSKITDFCQVKKSPSLPTSNPISIGSISKLCEEVNQGQQEASNKTSSTL